MIEFVRSTFAGLAVAALAVTCQVGTATFIVPATAHHTYVTKYDAKNLVRLRGVISSVNYRNPHIFFDLSVTNKDGSTTTWNIETESIAKVMAKGLKESKLRVGAQATVSGWRSRSGTAELGLKSITVGGKTYAIRRSPR